jgi:hypothetical protein
MRYRSRLSKHGSDRTTRWEIEAFPKLRTRKGVRLGSSRMSAMGEEGTHMKAIGVSASGVSMEVEA